MQQFLRDTLGSPLPLLVSYKTWIVSTLLSTIVIIVSLSVCVRVCVPSCVIIKKERCTPKEITFSIVFIEYT